MHSSRSPEGKAAKNLIAALDSFSFQDNVLAYMLANSNPHVQKRLFNVLLHCVRIWAQRYDMGIMDDAEVSVLVNSKRILEALERFGVVFTEHD